MTITAGGNVFKHDQHEMFDAYRKDEKGPWWENLLTRCKLGKHLVQIKSIQLHCKRHRCENFKLNIPNGLLDFTEHPKLTE